MANKPAREQDRPLVIGYLTPFLSGGVNAPRWLGVLDAASAHGTCLLTFPGGYYQETASPQAPTNVLYRLISQGLDGVVVGNILREDATPVAEMQAFFKRLDVPVVSLRESLPGIPYIPLENYRAMREAVLHLIQVHGRRRLAFLSGPEGHPYADERRQAYIDALRMCGISFDADLLTPPSDWSAPAVQVLLDERRLSPGMDFDAVVGVNDEKALAALQTLQARGVRVPAEVAIIGFNDHERGRVVTPTLTTVRPAFYEQGHEAFEVLLDLLSGRTAPEGGSLPVHLVIRESCGCTDPVVSQAAVGTPRAADTPLQEALAARHDEIAAEMAGAVATVRTMPHGSAESLLDSFTAELKEGWPGIFLGDLHELLRQAAATADPSTDPEQVVAAWNGAVSALRRLVLPHLLGDPEALLRAEDLWQQARIVIGKAVERVQVIHSLEALQREQVLREMGTRLVATFNLSNMLDVLAEGLPQVGIPGCYLSLYESPQPYNDAQPAPPWSRLVLAYDESGRRELPAGGLRFPSDHLVPAELSLWHQPRSFVVEPLYVQQQQIGFVLLQTGPRQPAIYETLRGEISNALQGALLVQQVERHALQLRTAAQVSHTLSSILDPEELCQQVVDLLSERFGLYYTSVFLVDQSGAWTGEAGRWVVLRAGAGLPGRQAAAQRLKVEIGGDSMVGWCVGHRQARLAARVETDEVYRADPLFPETRSELALPLRIGERVLGALDVQSQQENAFDEGYQRVLQTVADQLVVALENAQTMEGMRQLNLDLERTLKRQEQLLETVRALSTPVMPLLEGAVLLPLVGQVDSERAHQIMDELLAGVQRHRARVAIIDITGVAMMDSAVADSLLRTAQAVRLLGAEVMLVGIRPEVAQTVVAMGVDLSGLVTMTDLRSGIEHALRRLESGPLASSAEVR